MLLSSISIRNFRCHANLTDIPLHRLTVFIGENDAGKTGILAAIELLLTSKAPQPTDFGLVLGAGRGDEAASQTSVEIVVQGKFLIEPHDVGIPSHWITDSPERVVVTKTCSNGSVKWEVDGFGFVDSRYNTFDRQPAPIQKALLELLEIDPGSNASERKQQFEEAAVTDKISRHHTKITVAHAELAPYLPRLEYIASSDYRDPDGMVRRTLHNVVSQYVHPVNEAGEKTLLPALNEIQSQIQAALNSEAAKIAEVLRASHPRIQRVEVKAAYDFANVISATNMIVDLGEGLQPVSSFGWGTKKKIWFGLLDWERSIASSSSSAGGGSIVRAYDEPDINLDYAAERKLFANVLAATRDPESRIQSVVCTHSMTLVDRAPAESINLIRVDDNGMRQVEYIAGTDDEDVKEFLATIGRTVGLSNSAFFYERGFLIVEGESEDEAIPTLYRHLFNRSLIEDGIVLINLFTCSAWKSILKLLQRHRADRTVFLLDADCQNSESSGYITPATLEESLFPSDFVTTSCFYIGDKEFEDAFFTADIVNVLNGYWPRADGVLWTHTEIDTLRAAGQKFSEDIRQCVRSTCMPHLRSSFRKPAFAGRLAEHCRAESQIPQPIRDAFTAIRARTGIV